MTSRAALGIQPPPQNRIAGGARAAQTRSRPAAQISSALNEARKPASDSTGDEDKQRLAESRDVKPVSALANTNTQPSSTEPSTARSAHSDRQPVNTTPAVLFPPRPGHYNVDGHSQALRPSAEGASSLSRKELRSQSQEPPSESLQLPHHSTSREKYLCLRNDLLICKQSPLTTIHGPTIIQKTPSPIKPSSRAFRTNRWSRTRQTTPP